MKSAKRILHAVFGGCPNRKICSFYLSESETCIHGPYQYCGKHRSLVEQKSKVDMNVIKSASN